MRPRCAPAVLLSVALAFATCCAGRRTSRSEASFAGPDGVRIHYVRQGSGPPLVLIHGFALSAAINWIEPGAVDSLATAFTVIVPDLRGHGLSDKPHDPAAYGARFAADIVRLLDHLEIPKAHVAGYSMGGDIALLLAGTHPERVLSATVGGAGWTPPGTPPPPFVLQWLANLDAAARDHTPVSAALALPGFPPIPPETRADIDRNDAAALAAVLRSGAGLELAEAQVRAITVPVHAVGGEQDPLARGPIAALAQLLPTLTVTIIPGADHVVGMSHPRLAAAIRDFALAH